MASTSTKRNHLRLPDQGQSSASVWRKSSIRRREYGFGVEAGSALLLAVVAMTTNDTPIICNGFKDAEFIEMAMLALKMGRKIIPVVEKYTELGLVLEYAKKVGVRPQIGMRVNWRPAAEDAGSRRAGIDRNSA